VTVGSQSPLGLQNTWLVRPKRLLCNLPKVVYPQFMTAHINQREPHHSLPTVHDSTHKPV
jgi:hypothetical protein